jgi:hypothetical protein
MDERARRFEKQATAAGLGNLVILCFWFSGISRAFQLNIFLL